MTDSQIDQLLAAVRALPSEERRRLAQRVMEALPVEDRLRVVLEAGQGTTASAAGSAPSMLGLFADEPDLVDEVCRQAYADRATVLPRALDDE